MSWQIYKPEAISAKLRQVEILTSQGKSAGDAIRSIGVTHATKLKHKRAGWQRPACCCFGAS